MKKCVIPSVNWGPLLELTTNDINENKRKYLEI